LTFQGARCRNDGGGTQQPLVQASSNHLHPRVMLRKVYTPDLRAASRRSGEW
jgi:hypothetical protein